MEAQAGTLVIVRCSACDRGASTVPTTNTIKAHRRRRPGARILKLLGELEVGCHSHSTKNRVNEGKCAEIRPVCVFTAASIRSKGTLAYCKYFASQSRKVLYQSSLFCGFSTQCPSSGKSSSFEGTP